jgi:hypothetical protein
MVLKRNGREGNINCKPKVGWCRKFAIDKKLREEEPDIYTRQKVRRIEEEGCFQIHLNVLLHMHSNTQIRRSS